MERVQCMLQSKQIKENQKHVNTKTQTDDPKGEHMTFKQLNVIPEICNILEKEGYKNPTPIQTQAIPSVLNGRDVLGLAQTGTGKTAAFAIPTLQLLNEKKIKGKPYIRSLILTPTRELAVLIQESFETYGKGLPLKSTVIFGGVNQNPQVRVIRAGIDILVATPGRLLDLMSQGIVDLSQLEILTLDEADRMLDMGFIHDIKKILKKVPKQKQTLFFSATMPKEIIDIVKTLLNDPVRVAVAPVSSAVETVQQSVYYIDRVNKINLLKDLLKGNTQSVLIFTRTKRGADRVVRDLKRGSIEASAIHGDKSQNARQRALNDFKDGKINVLVATDIAARGIDVDDLAMVINYELPEIPETYVHRIGRTGRAGSEGVSISMCDFHEISLLKDIEKLTKKKIDVVNDHDYPLVDKSEKVKKTPPKRKTDPKKERVKTMPKNRQGKPKQLDSHGNPKAVYKKTRR